MIVVSLVLVFCSAVVAEAEQFALKLIDGHPCFRATISKGSQTLEAHVVLDLGMQMPIILHENTGKMLKIKPGDKVTVSIPGVHKATFADLSPKVAKVNMLSQLTQQHASELDEVPAVAVMGLPAFAKVVPQIDLLQDRLVLLPSEDVNELAKTLEYVTPYKIKDGGLFFEAMGPEEKKMILQFRTIQHDTIIDAKLATELGAANGDIKTLEIISKEEAEDNQDEMDPDASEDNQAKTKRINFAKFVAFRPVKLRPGKSQPNLIVGNNLLSSFRVTIDTSRKQLLWEQVAKPRFPTHERDFFTAMVEGNADAIEKYLKRYPRSRLSQEGCVKLLDLRLAEHPTNREAVTRAIEKLVQATESKRRSSTLIGFADKWLAGDRPDRGALALIALEMALKYDRHDLDATASHRIQARIGRIAYTEGDFKLAKRRLLSAAFGLPKDAEVNLWLGELYEAQKKPVRAWSRYLQATLAKKPPLAAYVGLGRLNRDPEFRNRFSMRNAAELLEGRSTNYHPKRHYVQDQKEMPQHVKLVELFTNIHDPKTTHGAEAALEAIGEYFDVETSAEPVALLEYHVTTRIPDPLSVAFSQKRAKFYSATQVPLAIFDGTKSSGMSGDAKKIEPVYNAYVKLVRSTKEKKPALKATLSGKVERNKRLLTGQVTVAAEGDKLEKAVLHVVTCESFVMSPGAAGRVIHRYVVRGALTPDEGLPVREKIKEGKISFTFDIKFDTEAFSEKLMDHMLVLEQQNKSALIIKPNYVDPNEVIFVAFIQDTATKEILGVTVIRPSENKEVAP
ncbi:MAG: hypothetical protein PVH19_09770 [Planctomycetia bacterium]|jgi:hypothetical protein